jgi:hypothetical protein
MQMREYKERVEKYVLITVTAQSKAWTVFAHLNHGIVGSNPAWGMDVCVRLFYVCIVLLMQVAVLWEADPQSRDSYLLCKKDQETEKTAKVQPTKGCRAIDRQIHRLIKKYV